ncbi:MAG TPA: c-type cytochrome domain-containing protein [Chitinophagaceae bacterium]|nr:c-type cytochrome domain-containing protein [Chitinophagaceae bacterium]
MSQFLGHFHVALVHLPIGILMLACVFQWLERNPKFFSLHAATGIALVIGMICAVLSVITGLLLSRTGDYDEDVVNAHQWLGIGVAIISGVMYYLYRRSSHVKLQVSASVLLFLLIIITGHLGGTLTHGSGYLSSWKSPDSSAVQHKPIANVQEAVVYTDIIQPLLQEKCYGCHGKNKQKGKLRMDDSLRLMKGGKDGKVVIPGNAQKSEMVKRTSLPRDDDDHMPPKEKPQLSQDQIALIHWWIASGASFTRKVKELDQPDAIKPALLALEKEGQTRIMTPDLPGTPVAKGDEAAIKRLTDLGVVVMPVAQNTNYLSMNFVTAKNVGDSQMLLLLPLKEQIIELKVGNTLISDPGLQAISQLNNLMHLQLDHTRITDKGIANLRVLQNLRYLNLVSTAVTSQGVMQLKSLRNLRSIYLYQTAVKKTEWRDLKRAFPKTLIDSGGYTVPFLPTDTIEVKPPKAKK